VKQHTSEVLKVTITFYNAAQLYLRARQTLLTAFKFQVEYFRISFRLFYI